MLKIYDDQIVYRFYESEKEEIAVIPGIESHWFYAPLWKNRKFLLQAGLATLLTNVFAVGTSLFALIVYNRIIPANAMASLICAGYRNGNFAFCGLRHQNSKITSFRCGGIRIRYCHSGSTIWSNY